MALLWSIHKGVLLLIVLLKTEQTIEAYCSFIVSHFEEQHSSVILITLDHK